MKRLISAVLLAGFVLGVWSSAVGAQSSGTPSVLLAEIDDAITPVMAGYVEDAIGRAEADGYEAVVIEMDTPGGLDTSMREIVRDILDAPVPVIVYVAPSGARAASAGAIIAMAAHVSAMAPGTAIGAATPVSSSGDDLDTKVINDAAAYAQSLAELRERDVQFAEDMVRDGRSISASEAVQIGAVDHLAGSLEELLETIDGETVLLGPDRMEHRLSTADAVVDEYDLGLLRSIRQFLANPSLAFLLLSLGTLGLIYELATPGIGAGALVAAVSFVLALTGLSVLPVNAAGLVFLGLAAAFFVAEVAAPGVGIAAAGGTIMLILSGVFLVDDAPGLDVSLAAVLPVAIVTGGFVIVAGRLALRARKMPVDLTGAGAFVGRDITVQVRDGRALAFVEGAWWSVRPTDGTLSDGDVVRVKDLDGLDLVVEQRGIAPSRKEPM